MSPQDDPTWPKCSIHNDEIHWCSFIRENFTVGEDADFIYPGIRISVPIDPTDSVWAEIAIDPESVVKDKTYKMYLVKDLKPFDQENFIYIGLWARGEGRLVISSVVNDLCAGISENKMCHHPRHGFQEEKSLTAYLSSSRPQATLKKVNNYYMTVFDGCIACKKTESAKGSPISLDGQYYGMGQVSVGGTTLNTSGVNINTSTRANSNTGNTAAQARARQALQSRFKR